MKRQSIRESVREIFPEWDRRPIDVWARDGGWWLTEPLAIRDCWFDASISRHFLSPLHALQSDSVREVSIRAPVRSAKTLIAEVFVAWCQANDPGETIWLCSKDPLATQEWLRWQRMAESSPKIASLLPARGPQGSRRDKAMGLVKMRNGSSFYLHGLADTNLQQKPCRYLINDECWEWPKGKLDEAYGRLGDYQRVGIQKALNISQGGHDGSDWDRLYSQGDCQEWQVECRGCHQHFAPLWTLRRENGDPAGMRWDEHKDTNGFWLINRCLDSVRYECPLCGFIHHDSQQTKQEWNRTGHYLATNAEARPEKKSFHWTAVIDFPWRELVDLYLQAVNALKQGDHRPLVKFFQKRMAENKSEKSIHEAAFNARQAIYDIERPWDGEYLKFFTIDVQEDIMWGLICAWTKNGRVRRLWFGKLTSYADIEDRRIKAGVKPGMTLLDTGYRAKGDRGVYAACVKYKWIGLKGVGAESANDKVFMHEADGRLVQHSFSDLSYKDPDIGFGPMAGRKAPLVMFASDVMADRLDALISSGQWEESKTVDPMDEEYRRQMTAEVKRRMEDQATGRTFYKRILLHKDNHAYDCAKMQVAWATVGKILPDTV